VTAEQKAAYDTLIAEVYAPVFFDKLASYGIVPATAAERDALLEIAEGFDSPAVQPVKAASQGSLIELAAHGLRTVRQRAGDPYFAAAADRQVKAAAAALAADPAVARAAALWAQATAS